MAASSYIGDVVNAFVPSIKVRVCYGSKNITNSCTIKTLEASESHRIIITGNPSDFYTLVMTDPDAPSPAQPNMREFVHWIVTDIPGGSNPAQGSEILPYLAPNPHAGIHRYILVIYKQKEPLGPVNPPITRERFSSRVFAGLRDLESPVAAAYFHVKKEPKNRKRGENGFI